jgi:hypothetical protein
LSAPYYPGQSARFTATAQLLGALYTPTATITVTLYGPLTRGATKLTQTGTPTVDSLGQLHMDMIIPQSAVPGPYTVRWLVSGSDAADTTLAEWPISVAPLSY